MDSVVAAHLIARAGGQDVIFTLATRDMNRLALQSHLLGAQLLGLQNVLVLQGDPLAGRDQGVIKPVRDYSPTELIEAIASLNQGRDFRGLKLKAPTVFCAGAVIDLSRDDVEAEARLAHRKVQAGAQFFITQPFHDLDRPERFHQTYHKLAHHVFPKPLFYGVQILMTDGLNFGNVPEGIQHDPQKGLQAVESATEQVGALIRRGMTTIYLVPPILRFGRRDYQAAQEVVRNFRSPGG